MAVHIVVDMLYDFIDGSLACQNAENAVGESVKYINGHPGFPVLYVCDNHPAEHCSFKENGGIWPPHCVQDTHGGSIHSAYYNLQEKKNIPDSKSCFFKGCNKDLEQYSGYEAVNGSGMGISDTARILIDGNNYEGVVISGIATEFCIKETALDFIRNGFKVTILKDALGYVDYQGHLDALAELEKAGANII